MELMLTRDHIMDNLFSGNFRSFSRSDYYAFEGVDDNALIANINVRRFILANGQALAEADYTVIFSPNSGEMEIYYFGPDGNDYVWLMNMITGATVSL